MNTRLVTATAVAFIATIGGGWLAADSFVSPEQRAARARAPAPRPVTVEVVRGVLADEVTARAAIGPQRREALLAEALPERAVVTGRLIARGARAWPGTPLVVINGRPLFVLPGRFALYRDIEAGMEGPDVAQLQAGLAAAGYPGALGEQGVYGTVTQDAVRQMYASAGAEPVERVAAAAEVPAAGKGRRSAPPPPTPIVPLSEVLIARHLPARVKSVAGVGARIGGDTPIATLATGRLVARARVAASVVGRIEPGMTAHLVGGNGRSLDARVMGIRRRRGARAGDLVDVLLRPAGRRRLPGAWQRKEVIARIITRLVRRRALIVPTRAIARDADGQTYVFKLDAAGSLARIRVRALGSLAGRTAVAPLRARALTRFDRVRVR